MKHGKPSAEMSVQEQLRVALIRCGQRLGTHRGGRQTQGRVLRILYLDGPLPQKALQERLGIRSASMSGLAAKLEARGLLTRRADPADHRQVLLELTDAGRADVQAYHRSSAGALCTDFAALTPGEQQALLALLERLLDSWDRAQPQ